MTEQPAMHELLQFDQSDRLRKSLKVAGISVTEMGDYLGVSRMTVSTWINGRNTPRKASLMLWALRTGVPFEWLTTGELKEETPPPGGNGVSDVRAKGFEPPTF